MISPEADPDGVAPIVVVVLLCPATRPRFPLSIVMSPDVEIMFVPSRKTPQSFPVPVTEMFPEPVETVALAVK